MLVPFNPADDDDGSRTMEPFPAGHGVSNNANLSQDRVKKSGS